MLQTHVYAEKLAGGLIKSLIGCRTAGVNDWKTCLIPCGFCALGFRGVAKGRGRGLSVRWAGHGLGGGRVFFF